MGVEQVLLSYLEHICGRENVRENVPLSTKTTIKIGGNARFFVVATSKEKLARLTSALGFIEYPYRIIGGGSNILAPDKGFPGVVIRLGFNEIIENARFIYADAGANLAAVAKRACDLGLCGLEFAGGIPGTVGGAVRGNAGAFGRAISDVVAIVDVLRNGAIVSVDAPDCKFAYRKSIFSRNGDIVLGAYFALLPAPVEEIRATMNRHAATRRKTQPNYPSAGSIFRNPTTTSAGAYSAGALIDRAGLKGFSVGGAAVSDLHANFIVNTGGATARDVERLVKIIKRRVHETSGVRLKTEIDKFAKITFDNARK